MSALPVDIQDLQPGRVQAIHQKRQEALHHRVSQIVIRLAHYFTVSGRKLEQGHNKAPA